VKTRRIGRGGAAGGGGGGWIVVEEADGSGGGTVVSGGSGDVKGGRGGRVTFGAVGRGVTFRGGVEVAGCPSASRKRRTRSSSVWVSPPRGIGWPGTSGLSGSSPFGVCDRCESQRSSAAATTMIRITGWSNMVGKSYKVTRVTRVKRLQRETAFL